ncbi:MAG: radical SAM protein [Alphaproteobacteria bacterium]|nr:radical SAM protein [Alphaproteobacteria bacterium]
MFDPVDGLNTGLEELASSVLQSAYSGSISLRPKLREQLNARGEKQAILARTARDTREKTGDNYLVVRASIEFSNYCRQICSYCGMAATNSTLQRYRLNSSQMCKIIQEVSSLGVTDLHLASGEDRSFKAVELVPVIAEAVSAGMEVTLVNGQRSIGDYALWKDAGASRYILKVETTNPEVFKDAKPGADLTQRVSHLLYLRELGFKIGSGVISGLPGQTVDDLVGDLIFLKELKPDMNSVSRFLPNSQSRYANASEGDPDTALNFLSLLRIEMSRPGLRIPAGTSLGRRQIDAFDHGANVVSCT